MDDELDSELLDLVDNHDNPKSHDILTGLDSSVMKPLDMETLPDNTGHFVNTGKNTVLYITILAIDYR